MLFISAWNNEIVVCQPKVICQLSAIHSHKNAVTLCSFLLVLLSCSLLHCCSSNFNQKCLVKPIFQILLTVHNPILIGLMPMVIYIQGVFWHLPYFQMQFKHTLQCNLSMTILQHYLKYLPMMTGCGVNKVFKATSLSTIFSSCKWMW